MKIIPQREAKSKKFTRRGRKERYLYLVERSSSMRLEFGKHIIVMSIGVDREGKKYVFGALGGFSRDLDNPLHRITTCFSKKLF